MTATLEACALAGRLAGRYPRMPDRALATEQASRRLAALMGERTERAQNDEPLTDFLGRIGAIANQLDLASPRDIRRLVDVIWQVDGQVELAKLGLTRAVAADRKSFDRAIVIAYLRRFPTHHAAFQELCGAVSLVANRRDWPWQGRGERWHLWRPDHGPDAIATALLQAEDPRVALRESGFEADLLDGGFIAAALRAACRASAVQRADRAVAAGHKLIAVFQSFEGAQSLNAHLARALLSPWVSASPPEDLRTAITSMLVRRIGDPRLDTTSWQFIRDQLVREFPTEDLTATIDVLRRWLVKATVSQFFEVIGRTTTNPDQWAQRESFWLAYLDAGAIDDAWFAFGPRAEADARRLVKDLEQGAGYGRIVGGGDSGHSALLMSMGDLRIAEWSHNGMCRFWNPEAKDRPDLSQREYSGHRLRRTNVDQHFNAMSHYSGWQGRFAYHIRQETGVLHPRWR